MSFQVTRGQVAGQGFSTDSQPSASSAPHEAGAAGENQGGIQEKSQGGNAVEQTRRDGGTKPGESQTPMTLDNLKQWWNTHVWCHIEPHMPIKDSEISQAIFESGVCSMVFTFVTGGRFIGALHSGAVAAVACGVNQFIRPHLHQLGIKRSLSPGENTLTRMIVITLTHTFLSAGRFNFRQFVVTMVLNACLHCVQVKGLHVLDLTVSRA